MPGTSTGAPGAPRGPDAIDMACLWSDIRLVASTGSTNADVLAQAARGAPEGLVIAAEAQTAGRGRQGRSWISRPGAALMFSVLLRPVQVPQAARGWVPLLAGVATASALRDVPGAGGRGIDARLKWPNDILVGERKLGGILAEQSGDAIVVGIGINLLGGEPDLPVPTATSLELHGVGGIDRTDLLAGILRQFERRYVAWRHMAWRGTGSRSLDADGGRLRAEYLRLSATVGRRVRVHLPGGLALAGTAADVDDAGRLLVRADDGEVHAISAGDVIHVRASSQPAPGQARIR